MAGPCTPEGKSRRNREGDRRCVCTHTRINWPLPSHAMAGTKGYASHRCLFACLHAPRNKGLRLQCLSRPPDPRHRGGNRGMSTSSKKKEPHPPHACDTQVDLGPIDCLIYNATYGPFKPLMETTQVCLKSCSCMSMHIHTHVCAHVYMPFSMHIHIPIDTFMHIPI